MPSPSVEVDSVVWSDGTDTDRARLLTQLLFRPSEGERDTGEEGGHDDSAEVNE
jgi:hypothetical protein